jgi:hypothetical protein
MDQVQWYSEQKSHPESIQLHTKNGKATYHLVPKIERRNITPYMPRRGLILTLSAQSKISIRPKPLVA